MSDISEEQSKAIRSLVVLSRNMQVAVLALMAATPIAFAVVISTVGFEGVLPLPLGMAIDMSKVSPAGISVIAVFAYIRPVLFMGLFALLWKLFSFYRQGVVFDPLTTNLIRKVAWLLIAVDLVEIAQRSLVGPLLGAFGATEPFFAVGIGLSYAAVGAMLLVIARIMALATALQEFERLTV